MVPVSATNGSQAAVALSMPYSRLQPGQDEAERRGLHHVDHQAEDQHQDDSRRASG